MAYSTNEQVAALCRNLLDGSEYFSTSSSPTAADVEDFLSSGCSIIETHLKVWGYNTPVVATATAYDWFSELNTLFAAARAEMTRINVTLSPGERTRGQVFDEMFWSGLKKLEGIDLTAAGLTKTNTGTTTTSGGFLYVGGTSVAEKSTREEDSDRVAPRFRRDMFRFPDSMLPAGADTDTDD